MEGKALRLRLSIQEAQVLEYQKHIQSMQNEAQRQEAFSLGIDISCILSLLLSLSLSIFLSLFPPSISPYVFVSVFSSFIPIELNLNLSQV